MFDPTPSRIEFLIDRPKKESTEQLSYHNGVLECIYNQGSWLVTA